MKHQTEETDKKNLSAQKNWKKATNDKEEKSQSIPESCDFHRN
jgi:hypothetical protein